MIRKRSKKVTKRDVLIGWRHQDCAWEQSARDGGGEISRGTGSRAQTGERRCGKVRKCTSLNRTDQTAYSVQRIAYSVWCIASSRRPLLLFEASSSIQAIEKGASSCGTLHCTNRIAMISAFSTHTHQRDVVSTGATAMCAFTR